MDYINYVKQSPMMGQIGLGGGATSLAMYASGTSVGPYNGDRGIVGGGGGGGLVNNISYTTISTSGSWSDFGNMNQSLYGPDGVSGGDGELGSVQASRGLIWGGDSSGSHTNVNNIQYLATATTANTQDFGDLSEGVKLSAGNFSNGWRCCYAGGANPNYREEIDYVATMTTGNAQDFGDLPAQASAGGSGQIQNGTNGFSFKGWNTAINVNTIATTGNATSFGSLSSTIGNNQAVGSNTTYGLHSGTNSELGIDRFTMATSGNGTDIGDLTANRWGSGGCSNMTYLLVVAGYDGNNINNVNYKAFATTGNASNFGGLNYTKRGLAGLSGSAS